MLLFTVRYIYPHKSRLRGADERRKRKATRRDRESEN